MAVFAPWRVKLGKMKAFQSTYLYIPVLPANTKFNLLFWPNKIMQNICEITVKYIFWSESGCKTAFPYSVASSPPPARIVPSKLFDWKRVELIIY